MKQPCALIALNLPAILEATAHNLPFNFVSVTYTALSFLSSSVCHCSISSVPSAVDGRKASEVDGCEFKSGP